MKKLLLVLVVGAGAMVSCNKTYTCTCTDTDYTSGGAVDDTYSWTYQVEEATNKQAEIACNGAAIVNTYSDGSRSETKCELSK